MLMGWKAFKEHFNIEHIVQINEGFVKIGSDYVSELVRISLTSGEVIRSDIFPSFLNKHYPNLITADPKEILDLLNAQDQFNVSIPVYSSQGSEIIEKFCEVPGYPNITHDGCLMYDNVFYQDKNKAIEKAKSNALSEISYLEDSIEDYKQQLSAKIDRLLKKQEDLKKLEKDYPSAV